MKRTKRIETDFASPSAHPHPPQAAKSVFIRSIRLIHFTIMPLWPNFYIRKNPKTQRDNSSLVIRKIRHSSPHSSLVIRKIRHSSPPFVTRHSKNSSLPNPSATNTSCTSFRSCSQSKSTTCPSASKLRKTCKYCRAIRPNTSALLACSRAA